ncbi:Stearoyl-CoA desaturase [Mycena indigotica]|uniref:Copper homeostasis protein cutC homolog n=1 Tax=Mycena indigotica TaxID=2126181 RepID=A0A8H6SYU6_9AGAR|nr:Stearoyl-CoA desaturase [Mycena indigotica]KAF7307151.1 Stearoyl-CoA desaturase [Mycena indigotica]
MLDRLTPEIILYIFLFLDLPELDMLSKLDPILAQLARDKALHNVRLRVVFPARVEHDLFAISRPTIPDLVHRGVMRGLSIERRFRAGLYFYSQSSVRQYEVSIKLARQHAGQVVSQHLTRRSAASSDSPLKQLYPDVSHNLARSLLPIARKLKWSLRRDTLAKMVRDKSGILGVGKWLEARPNVLQEGERVRLAICPDVRKIVGFYEKLGKKCPSKLVIVMINRMPNSSSSLIIERFLLSNISAVQGGANRLELCGNLGVGGGTTPSLGLLKAVQQVVDVPIMAMVRPRIGDFLYTPAELDVMIQDIRIFKENGVAGVVFGALKADGHVDMDATRRLVNEAGPLQVCFHRAFDMTPDPSQAFHDIASIEGVTRILTSGHEPTALEGLETLKSLCRQANKHLNILPGSGINAATVRRVLEALLPLGLTELHLSGGSWVEGGMVHRRGKMGMGVHDVREIVDSGAEWSVAIAAVRGKIAWMTGNYDTHSFATTTMSATVQQPQIWWGNALFFVSVHIAAVYGAFFWRPYSAVPQATLWLGFLVWQLADFGITIGYHRLYSHRAFRAKLPVRLVLAALGSAGFQGSIKRFTDDPVHDPYAATRGLFYSHMGWIFYKPTYERMELVDRDDLDSDPVVRFQHKHYVPLALFFGFVLPTLLGMIWGDPSGAYVWGGLVARLFCWHCTFLVNSLAHWDGLQPYSDEDTSRGNLILALLTGGEGSHNFVRRDDAFCGQFRSYELQHHSFPHDWRSGPQIWNWDPSKWIIAVLYRLGLVTGLRSVRDQDLKEALQYMGHKEKHGIPPPEEDSIWTGEIWDTCQARAFVRSNAGSCVVLIEDYFVNVTHYLGEHPGGASILRKYAVRPEEEVNEASWAFDGGLKLSTGDEDGSRAKRRKNIGMGVAGSSSDVDIMAGDYVAEEQQGQPGGGNVREQGMKLWQTIRDATNKDGFPIAIDFVRKPPKKLYPDYYIIIQFPIALEDIKKQLESNYYPTLEAVRQDFELCFENAKLYNLEESQIWKNAKDLLKLTNKTYRKMVPSVDEGDPTGKRPSLHRLAKTRLKQVIDKTDDNGRILSTIFMELPSRKEWPDYYLQIRQPRCLGAIMKKVKDKAYLTIAEFADDVELVFKNAMQFNLDHTQIWEDALTLKKLFGTLMSDLPPPFAMERYHQSSTKIKIKMPIAPAAVPEAASTSKVKLKVSAKAATPIAAPARLPSPTPPPPPPITAPKAPAVKRQASPTLPLNTLPSTNMIQPSSVQQQQQQKPTPIPQPAPIPPPPIPQPQLPYYPNTSYAPSFLPSPLPVMPLPQPAPVIAPVPQPAVINPAPSKSMSLSSSPVPPILPSHMLKGVSVLTEPCKRPFKLDYRDGVKIWVIRLGAGETALSFANITYMGDDNDDGSGSDVDMEDEEDAADEGELAVNGRQKPKTRGREGKSRAAAAAAKALQEAKAAKKVTKEVGAVQVKLNGNVINSHSGYWLVDIPKGSNIVEVGEKDGLIWKVYAERSGL